MGEVEAVEVDTSLHVDKVDGLRPQLFDGSLTELVNCEAC
jgi:hypothetical protein